MQLFLLFFPLKSTINSSKLPVNTNTDFTVLMFKGTN